MYIYIYVCVRVCVCTESHRLNLNIFLKASFPQIARLLISRFKAWVQQYITHTIHFDNMKFNYLNGKLTAA